MAPAARALVSLGLCSSLVKASPPGSSICLPSSHPLPYPRNPGLFSQLCQLGRTSGLRFLAGEKPGRVREGFLFLLLLFAFRNWGFGLRLACSPQTDLSEHTSAAGRDRSFCHHAPGWGPWARRQKSTMAAKGTQPVLWGAPGWGGRGSPGLGTPQFDERDETHWTPGELAPHGEIRTRGEASRSLEGHSAPGAGAPIATRFFG